MSGTFNQAVEKSITEENVDSNQCKKELLNIEDVVKMKTDLVKMCIINTTIFVIR